MATYLIAFITSTLLFAISSKVKKKQRIYIEIIAISVLCCVVGLRDVSVGTDTRAYFRPISEAAIESSSIRDYLSYSWYINSWSPRVVSQYEIGFILLIYVVGAITKSLFLIQFIIQTLIIVPVYFVIKKTKNIPNWLGMLIFDVFMFNPSLNMIRQSVAVSFVFLSTYFWIGKEHKKAMISLMVALSFHTSALIGIIIIILFEYVKRGKGKNEIKFNYNMFIAFVVGVSLLFLNNIIAKFLNQTQLARFAGYIMGNVKFMPNQIINRLPLLLLFVFSYKNNRKNIKYYDFYLLMFAYSLICAQFASVNTFGGRIAEYFSVFSLISCPLNTLNIKYKRLAIILTITYLIIYWMFYFVYSGSGETIPYVTI